MRSQFQSIERRARFRSSVLAYSGLFLLCGQFALFVRLTYWELSWDVMEPVSYFTGQLMVRTQAGMPERCLHAGLQLIVMRDVQAILMYTYFLMFRQDFTYENHFNQVTSSEKYKLIRQAGFDYDKYNRLLKDADRWSRFARSMARR
jgi:calcium uniporter protein, mitochondrial